MPDPWSERILSQLVDRALSTDEVNARRFRGTRPSPGRIHLDRPIDRLIIDAGFTFTEIDRQYGTGPRWSSYICRG